MASIHTLFGELWASEVSLGLREWGNCQRYLVTLASLFCQESASLVTIYIDMSYILACGASTVDSVE